MPGNADDDVWCLGANARKKVVWRTAGVSRFFFFWKETFFVAICRSKGGQSVDQKNRRTFKDHQSPRKLSVCQRKEEYFASGRKDSSVFFFTNWMNCEPEERRTKTEKKRQQKRGVGTIVAGSKPRRRQQSMWMMTPQEVFLDYLWLRIAMAFNAEGDDKGYFVTQSYQIRRRPHGRQRERRVQMLAVIFDKRDKA